MQIQRPKSLTELVVDGLREQIVSGELQLGETLSESRLAARLGVSRTPVREALARLEAERLVRIEPQRGSIVFTADHKALRDICDLRVCLETQALQLCLERCPKALAGTLKRIVAEMTAARRAADTPGYLRLDTAFHQAFFDHCENSFLADAYQTISAKMAALRNRLGDNPAHMDKSFAEHRRIAKAVAASDSAVARDTLVRHIGRKEGSYWQDQAESDLSAPPRR